MASSSVPGFCRKTAQGRASLGAVAGLEEARVGGMGLVLSRLRWWRWVCAAPLAGVTPCVSLGCLVGVSTVGAGRARHELVLTGSGCSGCAHVLPNASPSSPGLASPMGATSYALSRAVQPPNPRGIARVRATGGLVRGPGDVGAGLVLLQPARQQQAADGIGSRSEA